MFQCTILLQDSLLESGTLPEVVCVCTPNGLHTQQCAFVFSKLGCHVVLEKPIALSASDARSVSEVSSINW